MDKNILNDIVYCLQNHDFKSLKKKQGQFTWDDLNLNDVSVLKELDLVLDSRDDCSSIREKSKDIKKIVPVMLEMGFNPLMDVVPEDIYLSAVIFGGDGPKPSSEQERVAREYLHTWVDLFFKHNICDGAGNHLGHIMANNLIVEPWYFKCVPDQEFAKINNDGNTMLHLILRDEMREYDTSYDMEEVANTILLMLDKGCRWDSKNNSGQTPLSLLEKALEKTQDIRCDAMERLLALGRSVVEKQDIQVSLKTNILNKKQKEDCGSTVLKLGKKM